MSRFSNRRTLPTEEDFQCAPGINPGVRQADWQYLDEDLQEAAKTAQKTSLGLSTPVQAVKTPGIEPQARRDPGQKLTQVSLFDF